MKRIGLFCGGFSSEYAISILSANTIQANFPTTYEVVKIVVSKEQWLVEFQGASIPFDLNTCQFTHEGIPHKIDIGLVYIHGNPGENGKIQAFLDMHEIPYLNAGPLASSLSFDKWYCNQFLRAFDIPVAKSIFLTDIHEKSADEIINTLGLPIFVKPSDSGSSYGISKVKHVSELDQALKSAFNEGKTVVLESFLDGTEVTCGVYQTTTGIQALPLTEIASENEFFDYDAKYNGKSQEITPARISNEMSIKVQERAKKIYQLLQLRSISRIDFMIVGDEPHVIEVNTTPGFSPASIVPQMLACAGISITAFWESIVEFELTNTAPRH
jgi:D-alanine-D-alanine ligase